MGKPDLADKVAYLRTLGGGAEVIETHFAWVFLSGDKAYKIRKPVRRDTMDYTTLEARQHDCREEVRLNRRLAPLVYLRAVPLMVDERGRLALDGTGTLVDWVVEMRRLQRARMLDAALALGPVPPAVLEPVVELLARFYRANALADLSPAHLSDRILRQIDVNCRMFAEAGIADAPELATLQRQFVVQHMELLAGRVTGGCVVEGHGDLRPEHVYLGDPVAVIDCLEFDRDLRILDRAEELSFLALECAKLGAAATGELIRRACLEQLGDTAPTTLLDFYLGHRAAMRARIYIWRANEPDDGKPEHWLGNAVDYVERALGAARRSVA